MDLKICNKASWRLTVIIRWDHSYVQQITHDKGRNIVIWILIKLSRKCYNLKWVMHIGVYPVLGNILLLILVYCFALSIRLINIFKGCKTINYFKHTCVNWVLAKWILLYRFFVKFWCTVWAHILKHAVVFHRLQSHLAVKYRFQHFDARLKNDRMLQ